MKWMFYEWKHLRKLRITLAIILVCMLIFYVFYFNQANYALTHSKGLDAWFLPITLIINLELIIMLLYRSLYYRKLQKRRPLIIASSSQIVIWKYALIVVTTLILYGLALLLCHITHIMLGDIHGFFSTFADKNYQIRTLTIFANILFLFTNSQLLFLGLREIKKLQITTTIMIHLIFFTPIICIGMIFVNEYFLCMFHILFFIIISIWITINAKKA